MTDDELVILLERLIKESRESEWVEFKLNYHSAEELGQMLSGLSNGACLEGQPYGYLVFGVKNDNNTVEGTTFKPKSSKHKNEDIEHWLLQRLNPRIDFHIYEFEYNGKYISIFEIPATANQPVDFMHESYIRVASITRKLKDFPDKERKIWKKEPTKPFEKEVTLDNLSASDVVRLLDTQSYFELMKLPFPTNQDAVIQKMISEKLVVQEDGHYAINNLGSLLFAKNLNEFTNLNRKAVRVIVYKSKNKLDTLKDQTGTKGYAVGFESLVNYINDQLPQNEEISKALRDTITMYPEKGVRELVANTIIHQDFREKGSPVIEIYSDRIEFSNSGLPVITPMRFIDDYQSRNEILADMMRRLRICEEKGSGIDKVVALCEMYQLPAPNFIVQEKHTKVIMYAHQGLNNMDRQDKIRACYQHSCLKYVSNEKMSNQTLRERFKIEEKNSAIASRIIRDTIEAELIKEEDPNNKSKKYASYVPIWA
ncbi:MAG: transcriptional regulator [Candidatus Brocadiaceae bacterium]|nr:transcriptional regulator [Candidatus Brocadiaceae bacterium]